MTEMYGSSTELEDGKFGIWEMRREKIPWGAKKSKGRRLLQKDKSTYSSNSLLGFRI